MGKKKNTGYCVITKSGKPGKIYHNEEFIDGKVIVHIDKWEKPLLCEPESIQITGYFD